MAFEKIWRSDAASSTYSAGANWRPISVRTAAYSWTLSGSGTSNYYLRTSGGTNPGITVAPGAVYLGSDTAATSGTAGSLIADRWGYGDADTLGYSTIYVRTSGSVDPDSLAADYVRFSAAPIAADNVTIPVDGYGTIAGGDFSATAINRFVTEKGWPGVIGAAASFLRIDPDFFEWNGGGGFVDIGAAAIEVAVRGTTTTEPGYRSLTIKGTAITSLDVQGGSSLELPTGTTATDLAISSGELWLASGSTASTLTVNGGTVHCRGTLDDITGYAGRIYLYGTVTGQITVDGSCEVIWMDGTLPAVLQDGGIFDERQSGLARTCSEYRWKRGQHKRNYEAVTHSDHDIARSLDCSAS